MFSDIRAHASSLSSFSQQLCGSATQISSLPNVFLSTGCPCRMGQVEERCLFRVFQLWIFPCAPFPAWLQVMKAKALRKTLLPLWQFGSGDLCRKHLPAAGDKISRGSMEVLYELLGVSFWLVHGWGNQREEVQGLCCRVWNAISQLMYASLRSASPHLTGSLSLLLVL